MKFPIGIADFRSIRTEDYYYVDKTSQIDRLVSQGKYYFLSRPRRFGKSLLLDTIEELFECNEPLFQGLHIHDRWDWSAKYPVVRLSFDANYSEPAQLKSYVINRLKRIARSHNVPSEFYSDDGPQFLENLLWYLHDATNRQVVVLVDEYDKPVLDSIDNPELAIQNRDYLQGFYGAIKGSANHIRFLFVTGITMFSKMSLFSTMNNLKNISIDPRYATICGYTESDLDSVFASELEGLDRREIQRWYNGYSWRGNDAVYNPWAILNLFDTREFKAHWFTTGLPAFLYRIMMDRQFTPLDIENLNVAESFVSTFDVNEISAEALMFQTGFLTITGEQWDGLQTIYELDYPNFEVRMSLNQGYLNHLYGPGRQAPMESVQLAGLLVEKNFDGFAKALRIVLDGIPNQWHSAYDMAQLEGWYSSIVYACLQFVNGDIRAEESTRLGRSDLVLVRDDQVFLFEFKMLAKSGDADRVASEAIRQIRERDYASKYRDGTKNIHLIGMVFCAKKRNLATLKVEPD